MNRARIREILLANGFTIKDGHDDLKPYVYEAVEAVLEQHALSSLNDMGYVADPKLKLNWDKLKFKWAFVEDEGAAKATISTSTPLGAMCISKETTRLWVIVDHPDKSMINAKVKTQDLVEMMIHCESEYRKLLVSHLDSMS